jgi:hypothetical protein
MSATASASLSKRSSNPDKATTPASIIAGVISISGSGAPAPSGAGLLQAMVFVLSTI